MNQSNNKVFRPRTGYSSSDPRFYKRNRPSFIRKPVNRGYGAGVGVKRRMGQYIDVSRFINKAVIRNRPISSRKLYLETSNIVAKAIIIKAIMKNILAKFLAIPQP